MTSLADKLCSTCMNGSNGHIVNSQHKEQFDIKIPYCQRCFNRTDDEFKLLFEFIPNET